MALFQSKYGVINQIDERTYQVGNYRIIAKGDMWELAPSVAEANIKTWLESASVFYKLDDAFRVAIVFTREDGIAPALKDLILHQSHTRQEQE